MHSILSLKLNYSPVVHCRSTKPSAATLKVQLPECFISTTWPSRSEHISLNHHVNHKGVSKLSSESTRVASLDVPQVCQEDEDLETNIVEDSIKYIKNMLSTFDDGRISVSPYDTAWVSLIKNIEGHDTPQFPSSIEWIAQNQLPDGSWGDEQLFCPYDRLVNTLACVVALRSWNVHADKSEKGISFIKENVGKLENANAEHMTCGFEVVFPALLQRAKSLGIDNLPYDAPVVREIYTVRDLKMKRIPKELMHKVPTSLLFSLEGLEDLDWQKLLKLQSSDGSFLTSPSSTAFAFMQTKDEKCFEFIKNTVEKLNGGVFNCRFWTEKGYFSGRDSEFCDLDDTSMAFRLLRLQGYDVTPNVLKNFQTKDNKFSCYGGQMIESSSPIYNLYRASQILFPGEKILEEAKSFSYNFLQESLANNQLLDKWVISEHLPDEIEYGLQMPWYANLPRVENRFYLEHYGGGSDVWIGKTLYRMEEISNDTYLKLARLDFNRCQAQHQIEWTSMQEWYEICNVQVFGISRKDLLLAYFLATASIFEPERSKERIAWAKSQIISKMINSLLVNKETKSWEQQIALLSELKNNTNGLEKTKSSKREEGLINILVSTIHQFLEGFDGYISQQLKNIVV
ncbi:hypothetical protein BUALT_Bualt10G0094100 [Buddleja alternifolia]|uniref:Terpene synthase N-terminal domain-containing protein n=1 Tax=Buddleja alternifolia TaxID=168488 RepID=A0AAV6WY24_9LAMI|nr:hypothetical protein BUALT_Bualt10G0094100 [Buddleja alternifolia]